MVSVRGNQTNNKVTASPSTSTNNRAEVKPVNINNQVEATNNLAKYYSEISQDWAVGEGLIQGIDYSSKTYALQAKESANEAKESMEITQGYMDNAISNIQTAETNALNNIVMQEESALSTVNQGVEQLNTTITEGLENINTSVTGGVSTIETLQANSLAEITTNKESALSDITTAETNALNNIDTDFNNATSEINTNRANTLAQISTLANTSISDINAVGKSYDNLTHKNITNCLLEVPQRIKYTLENGTLTIKAGSVVIVPYGTEDLSSTYPVGSNFMSDAFKVVDTQFTDGKFFVWCELLKDSSSSTGAIGSNHIITLSLGGWLSFTVQANCSSGSGLTPATYSLQYDTSANYARRYGSSTSSGSINTLPILDVAVTVANKTKKVNQVFNGMGYIGSTIWVDKGVKGLIPNGRNEDGSLKNNEFTFSILKSLNCTHTNTQQLRLGNNNIQIGDMVYDETNNQNTINGQYRNFAIAGEVTASSGVISNFNPKQPFRAVDYSELPITDICTTKATTASTATQKKPAVIVQNYVSGTSWYRVWSDGWIEQGGYCARGKNVTYLKAFSDNNYTLVASGLSNSANTGMAYNHLMPNGKSTTGFTGTPATAIPLYWYACGY